MKNEANKGAFLILLATAIFAGPVLAQSPMPGGQDMTIEARVKDEAIHSLEQNMKGKYVFPDIGERVAKMLEERHARGEYKSISSAREFADLLTKQMKEVAHDAHLRVAYSSQVLPPMPALGSAGAPPPPSPEMLARMKNDNYGFEKAEVLRGNVGILTSHRTFSGAEEFTNDLKALKRATVVGETTGGGANPGGFQRLGDHFMAFIPEGTAINPITKTNWEGKGVEPDIQVSQEEAFKTAYVTTLKHLIERAADEQKRNMLKHALSLAEAESVGSDVSSTRPPTAAAPAAPADLTGMWTGQINGPNGDPHNLTFIFKADGNQVTGTISGGPPNGAQQAILNGKTDGDNLSFEVTIDAPGGGNLLLKYVGKIGANQIRGSLNSPMGSLPFTVTKK